MPNLLSEDGNCFHPDAVVQTATNCNWHCVVEISPVFELVHKQCGNPFRCLWGVREGTGP